jgi:hypothetical protein
MNFNDLENLENLAASDESTKPAAFHLEIIADYLEKEKRKNSAKDRPFEYFYEDVSGKALAVDFRTALGEKYYKPASDDAQSCLNICNEFRKISSWSIVGWLQNALKFADHIVLHYIQEKCKLLPERQANAGVEKSRYIQLSKMQGDIAIAGALLKDLYDLRNGLEHRTITHNDGRQELISPKRNLIRKEVVKMFPEVFRKVGLGYL